MSTQNRNNEITNLMGVDSYKFGLWTEVIAGFQAIPGLVGFWPMSSIQRSTGNVYDLSGQGRTLTRNGNSYGIENLVPYANFNGTTNFLSRADETDLDILGTETIYNSEVRGLTIGGWFLLNVTSNTQNFVSKHSSSPNFGYTIAFGAGSPGFIRFNISTNGTSSVFIDSTETITTSRWYYLVGRFTPSTELAIFVNGAKSVNTTSIPATIFNNSQPFVIGARSDASQHLNGRATLCFLSANALSDSIINGLYQRSRLLFGV